MTKSELPLEEESRASGAVTDALAVLALLVRSAAADENEFASEHRQSTAPSTEVP